jgi:hypothetical protein
VPAVAASVATVLEVSGEITRRPVLAEDLVRRRNRSREDDDGDQGDDDAGGERRVWWWCKSGRGSRRSCVERSGIIVEFRSMTFLRYSVCLLFQWCVRITILSTQA